ncbi:alpha/beta fold hydrolase [Arthrobacter sp. S2(2024)]|uniref:alpha/beta fold hydrolase n=1 Tax=Arthrobacter sp. S2(2024) TaxID=3111911 RepID=UPI002FC92E17
MNASPTDEPGKSATGPDPSTTTASTGRTIPRRRRVRLITGWLALLAGVLAAGLLLEAALIRHDQEVLPVPGRLVHTSERTWRLDCTGEGELTVILEAGLGESGLTWSGIQPALSRTTRVCSYDRAGYGWSDPGVGSRDAVTEAADLNGLLQTAGVRGPYIMVGHSLGSFIARLYAARYPDEVAGLVLVDPTNENSALQAGEPRIPALLTRGQALISRFGLLRPFISGLVADQVGENPPEAITRDAPFLYRASALDTNNSELSASLDGANQVTGQPLTDRSLPAVVLLTTDSVGDTGHFQTLTKDTRVIDAGQSSHYVHYSHPDLVLTIISEVLTGVRN